MQRSNTTLAMMVNDEKDGKRDALCRIAEAFDRCLVPLTLADIGENDGALVIVNQAFCDLTGYSRDESIGDNCRFLQRDLENEVARAEIRDILAQGVAGQVILRNRRKSGEIFDNLLLLQPLKDRARGHRYYLGSQFDLTVDRARRDLDAHLRVLDAAAARLYDLQVAQQAEQRQMISESARSVANAWLARH